MNPFYNSTENRPRAWVRIPVYTVLAFLFIAIAQSLPLGGLEFVLTAGITYLFFWVMFHFADNRKTLKLAGITLSPVWWQEFGFGVLIGFVAMLLIFGVQLLSGTITFMGFGWESSQAELWIVPVAIFFLQMACVGFYEELMSRSYLLTNFKEGFTFGGISTTTATFLAILFSSSIFGFLHLANPNVTIFAIINIVLAGVMLAIPYVLTGRLAYSVGLHFSWNFFQGGVFGFRVSGLPIRHSVIQIQQGGEAFLTGGSFGPEGGLIGTGAIILICAVIIFIEKKRTGAVALHPFFTRTYLQNEEKIEETA